MPFYDSPSAELALKAHEAPAQAEGRRRRHGCYRCTGEGVSGVPFYDSPCAELALNAHGAQPQAEAEVGVA